MADTVANKKQKKMAGMKLDKVANKVADMVADNKKKTTLTFTLTWKSNLVRELVTGIG